MFNGHKNEAVKTPDLIDSEINQFEKSLNEFEQMTGKAVSDKFKTTRDVKLSVVQIILLLNIRECAQVNNRCRYWNDFDTGKELDLRALEDRDFNDSILINASKEFNLFDGYNKQYDQKTIKDKLWVLKKIRDDIHINGAAEAVPDIRINNGELAKEVNNLIEVVEILRANNMRQISKFRRDA